MTWFPPKSYAARMEWSRQHPWIAASYFATVMSVLVFFLPVLIKTNADLQFRAVLALVMWPPTALVFGLSVKYRVGLRPDAEDHPLPTALAPWRWASRGFLSAMWWFGVVSVPVTFIQLVWGSTTRLGSISRVGAAIAFCFSLGIAVTTWQERKRRRTPP